LVHCKVIHMELVGLEERNHIGVHSHLGQDWKLFPSVEIQKRIFHELLKFFFPLLNLFLGHKKRVKSSLSTKQLC
jgi:hypothetical protein